MTQGTRDEAPLACVVLNPSKPAVTPALCSHLADALEAAGYRGPLWLETSRTQTGTAQARQCVASGARLVLAVGGDGTLRSVAAGLAGTDTVLGIIALGTANLAARNLGLRVGSLDALIATALHARPRVVDLSWVSTDPSDADLADLFEEPPGGWARPSLGHEHACLVVAGIGFDADLVASTRPDLKARLKWGAYALAAFENLSSPRMDLVVSIGEEVGGPGRAEVVSPRRHLERLNARTLLVANGGRLPAGIVLLREAAMDDGVLDVAAIDTVGGIVGWTSLARQVLPPYAATYTPSERALGRVVLRRGRDVVVRTATPALVQVDGDLLPPTRSLRVRLQPAAVRVSLPEGAH
ncbi:MULTISPECIES: diacylglycerol/lipid kinase family protein [Actinomyces]|uniref:Diacylglycerol kinase n=1 Tax=Actinomyces respiraculi TaxID=2744574 RepID=A0A7T0LKM3_9ACTO|nr:MULTISPECIES: diacylglycerol kinase family protein [Actinomyces]QPL05506.1 diacylglycerol kinase [Actinomyces respiraculi]